MERIIHPCRQLRGEMTVPGDKSISHRAVMLGALASGKTEVSNFLMSADCLSTISCFEKMGIEIEKKEESASLIIQGRSLQGLSRPEGLLYTGNSGTTTRILSGILAGQSFDSVVDGDSSIRKRPMKRVIDPLTAMGAEILSEKGCVPMTIRGKKLHPVSWHSPVASAQVKSCILLAGLYADGETSVIEPSLSRDHTERMLEAFGGRVKSEYISEGVRVSVQGAPMLTGRKVIVPGDISSAAFFLAAAAIVPGSELCIRNVGTNPTRDGILKVLRSMGADFDCEKVNDSDKGEEISDITIRSSSLHGTVIEGSLIPTLIDELPVCAVLAAFAEGETVIRDAKELRVKESDRIAVMTEELSKMGVDIRATDDGMIIQGGKAVHGASVKAHDDHRIAMSLAVAALAAEGESRISGAESVSISYPSFFEDLERLAQEVPW